MRRAQPEHGGRAAAGALIINADDWGRDRETTDRTAECVGSGSITSVSAMVYMEDSERAATMARERAIDAGLHLNLTTPFSAPAMPPRLAQHQDALAAHLFRHRLSPVVFNPALMGSFRYVVQAQIDEFARLYGAAPYRIDGHHHMHLCANVIFAGLMPAGAVVRRNFSFRPGEKSVANRTYRRFVDAVLGRRHPLVDFLFVLPPPDAAGRLQQIVDLARESVVELEAHPVIPDEYAWLTGGGMTNRLKDARVLSHRAVAQLRQWVRT
jgi:chitin disaccharide deacetylase